MPHLFIDEERESFYERARARAQTEAGMNNECVYIVGNFMKFDQTYELPSQTEIQSQSFKIVYMECSNQNRPKKKPRKRTKKKRSLFLDVISKRQIVRVFPIFIYVPPFYLVISFIFSLLFRFILFFFHRQIEIDE